MNFLNIRYKGWHNWLLAVLILSQIELINPFILFDQSSPLLHIYGIYFERILVIISSLLVIIPLAGLCFYFVGKNIGWYLLFFFGIYNILKILYYIIGVSDISVIFMVIYLLMFLSALFILFIAQKNGKFNLTRNGLLITLLLVVALYIVKLNAFEIAGNLAGILS